MSENTEVMEDVFLNTSKSITHCRKVACGHIYLTFVFKEDGKIDYVLINGPRSDCKAWYSPTADNLTFSLRRIRPNYTGEVEQIIKNFIGHRCDKQTIVGVSCIHAIGQILREVLVKPLPLDKPL